MTTERGKTTVQIELPQGVASKEEFDKLLATFVKQRISGKARDKAIRDAQKKLIAAHKAEYDGYVAAGMPKG